MLDDCVEERGEEREKQRPNSSVTMVTTGGRVALSVVVPSFHSGCHVMYKRRGIGGMEQEGCGREEDQSTDRPGPESEPIKPVYSFF